jgi:cell wall-associated NlpC family hydrolase
MALGAGCRTASLPAPREPGPVRATSLPPAVRGSPAAARVVSSARSVLGAPYRYSGADPRGFDCSGLVFYAFASAGMELPRTAASQAESGRWVPLDELAAGDLVFFAAEAKPNHVGLVVSAPGEPLRMIHAASSTGVIETDVLREPHWLERLRFGRRVLP